MATLENLGKISEYHEGRLRLLESILERQQSLLEEVQRDAARSQRMWVWICKRYGLPEDEDPKGPWDKED